MERKVEKRQRSRGFSELERLCNAFRYPVEYFESVYLALGKLRSLDKAFWTTTIEPHES